MIYKFIGIKIDIMTDFCQFIPVPHFRFEFVHPSLSMTVLLQDYLLPHTLSLTNTL